MKIDFLKALGIIITGAVCAVAVAIALLIGVASPWYVHWAVRHPAALATHDPHHWLLHVAEVGTASFLLYAVWLLGGELRRRVSLAALWWRLFMRIPRNR